MRNRAISRRGALAGMTALIACPAYLRAQSNEEIEVSNYGTSPGGFPYAVALGKGLFREFGVNIAGVRGSPGSAPTIRNMIAGGLTFADAGITGVISANRSGANIRVIGNSTDTFAEVTWVTMPDSQVRSITDLRGRRLGFTTARSATNMLAVVLVDAARLQQSEVQLIAAGGFPQALTVLEAGGIDVAPMVEPNFSVNGTRYRVLAPSNELFPAMSNTCCLTTAAKARSSGDFLRGVLAARRKAVDALYEDPAGSADAVATAYRIERPLAERVIRNMIAGSVGEVGYWSRGRVRVPTIDRMMQGARLVGIIDGAYDVREIVDQSFLPADQREAG